MSAEKEQAPVFARDLARAKEEKKAKASPPPAKPKEK